MTAPDATPTPEDRQDDDTSAPADQDVAPRHAEAAPERGHAWRTLRRALSPRLSTSRVVAALLCALLGFALVVQVQQTQTESLSSLRQSELVRILDEVTQRGGDLENEVRTLREQRDELQSGTADDAAALEVAVERAERQGILSGRLPAVGPGVTVRITEGDTRLRATALLTVLEELRNAGAEVIELNGVRLVASSYLIETSEGIVVDGQIVSPPFLWAAIGDPSALGPALEIPGGAMSTIRTGGGTGRIDAVDELEINAVREPAPLRYAEPATGTDSA